MKNDWILDVLADLKAFAHTNGLTQLAEKLEDTSLVAAAEIESGMEEPKPSVDTETGESVRTPGRAGTTFRS